MDEKKPCEATECPCRPAPQALEARLDRLEGFLHHLMNDVMDALKLLAAAKEAAGVGRGGAEG